jgi:predicted PurR-regulated permease PerM
MLAEVGISFAPGQLRALVLEAARGIQGVAVSWGSALLGNTLAAVVHFAVILIVVFYTLVDGERFKEFAFELSPLPDDEDAAIVETFKKVAAGVVVGNGLGSGLQGLLGGLAMTVVGLSSPVLWGSVMAVSAFLPLVGISVVVVPASAYLALQGRPWVALGFLAFCTIQGLFVENVVKTKLIGSRMRMHDLLVFLCILGGVAAFGVVGLVYGPLIAMLFITFNSLYRQRYRPQLAQRYAQTHPMPKSSSTRRSSD